MIAMTPLRVPITISPHTIEGKLQGHYILVHSLWKDTQPVIFKDQFAGYYRGSLILTMAHPSEWRSFVQAVIHSSRASEDKPSCWLAAVKMTRMGTGVRYYLPGTVLKPNPGAGTIKLMGLISKASYGSGDVIYVVIPKIDGDILLGRGKLE